MTTLRIALAAGLVLASVQPALAQNTYPTVTLFGESDAQEDLVACKVTHASAIRAGEDALHKLGIKTLPHTSETRSKNVLLGYLSMNAIPVMSNGKPTGTCAISLEYQLKSNGWANNPVTGQQHFAGIVYCFRNNLMVWNANSAQAEMNRVMGVFINDCIKEYDDSKE